LDKGRDILWQRWRNYIFEISAGKPKPINRVVVLVSDPSGKIVVFAKREEASSK
jgi:hypothetical protein